MDGLKRLVAACQLISVLGVLLGNECRAEDPKDILYYGNSFTNATCCGGLRSVPDVIKDIAVAAGHPAPRNRNAAVDGQSLEGHRTNNTAVINTGITPPEKWEHVVLQDFSTQPTHIGNLALHRSSAVGLYDLVDNHSPDVEAVMFETWARGPGHSYYTGGSPVFPGGPAHMQQELRDGYHLSTADINAAAGVGAATYAPVGDAWENAGFPLNLYAGDIYHAQNRGSLLTALVLYGIIYDDFTTSDINLTFVLANLNGALSPADARYVTASQAAFLTSSVDDTLMPEPPGDFNDDGKVDAADYVVWRKNEGTMTTLPNDNGIGGTVGAVHFNLWREHFGNMAMTGSGGGLGGAAVPEPATVLLGLIGVLRMIGLIGRR